MISFFKSVIDFLFQKGNRKYIFSILTLLIVYVGLCFKQITSPDFSQIVIALISAFVAGNGVEHLSNAYQNRYSPIQNNVIVAGKDKQQLSTPIVTKIIPNPVKNDPTAPDKDIED